MKIFVGADHNGFEIKGYIKTFLKKGYDVVDVGNQKFDPDDDYPIFAIKLGKAVVKHQTVGILVCGSGHGICIVVNKVRGVRAATVNNVEEAKLVKEHNNANVICISGWNKPTDIGKIITTFLTTKFSRASRHRRRVKMIDSFERKQWK